MRESEETVTEALSFDEYRRYSVMTVSCLDEGRLFGVQSRSVIACKRNYTAYVPSRCCAMSVIGAQRSSRYLASLVLAPRTTGVRRWKRTLS